MKTTLLILLFLPFIAISQTISKRVTDLEIYDINNNKSVKALVKSDSLAASRELILNAAFNAFQLEYAATKQQFQIELKKINDSLVKYKTYYFDTSFNHSKTQSFRVLNDTISVKEKSQ